MAQLNLSTTFYAIGVGAVMLFHHEILNTIKNVFNFCCNHIKKQITINPQTDPKCAFAVRIKLENYIKQYKKKHQLLVTDGIKEPVYKLAPGKYSVCEKGWKWINIKIDDNKIILYSYFNSFENIKKFISDAYISHCSSDKITVFFTSESDKWSFPILRKAKDFQKMKFTQDMNSVMQNVHDFKINMREYYHEHGIPYRKGYMLKGKPGTGKSTIIEIIAAKYQMSVYLVNLNSNNMCDTTLINLVSRVPTNSIIAIEEIDKQLDTLEKNSNNKISFGGLLSALDGPQRLDEGCIIILTTNDDNFLDDENRRALFRKGRIDKTFELKTEIWPKNN